MAASFLDAKLTRRRLDAMIERYRTDEVVLDLGSGRSPYREWFPRCVSVDLDPESGADIVADVHRLPIGDAEYGFILSIELLEHVRDPRKVADEMYRVLKPGGLLVLSTRFTFPIHHAPRDYYRFTKYGLLELFERFEVVELREETSNFETLGVLIQRLAFQSDFRLNGLVKFLLLVAARCVGWMNFLITRQYGRRNRTIREDVVLASGYFLVCRKPPADAPTTMSTMPTAVGAKAGEGKK